MGCAVATASLDDVSLLLASHEEPMLAGSEKLDMATVPDLVLDVGEDTAMPCDAPVGIVSTPLNEALADTTVRLLKALSSTLDAQVLGPNIEKELCYRVLMGSQGGAIRAALANQRTFGRVARILRRIHRDYAQPLNVSDLASEAGLSVPAFHGRFKAVTATSPIQHIKSIRLHEARLMMIRDALNAASAAARVGYESPSQFNREFKRMFGRSPCEEAKEMRSAFALAAPHCNLSQLIE